jgi:putative toxin-antitoxin system antitoxin component (TIGR02293 family)
MKFPLSKFRGKACRHTNLALPDNAVDQVIDRATDVIGNREEAMRWLGTPVRGLDFATPISVLTTEEGAERVNDILGRMEHGIW